MEKTKIAFFNFSLAEGGAARNAINLTNKVNKSKSFEAHLILLKNICEYDVHEQKIIYLLKDKNHISLFLKPVKLIEACLRLFFIIKKNKYQLLISETEMYVYYFNIIFTKIFNIKSLLVVGNNFDKETEYLGPTKIVHKLLYKFSLIFTDRIICVSNGLANYLKEKLHIKKDKIQVIYNGIDKDYVKKMAGKPLPNVYKKLFKENKVIVTIGRLVKRKGHITLIKSFKLLKKNHQNIKLMIIGSGNQLANLKKLVGELNLTKDVSFIGFSNNPYQYLKKAYMFVFPSYHEGLGNAIIEAMICRLPIISSDCQFGPRELLCQSKNEYGILIPPNEENILAQKIDKLLEDGELAEKYRCASGKRAKQFSLEKMSDLYMKTFVSML